MDRNAKLKQIEQFREQIEQLEYELREEPLTPWQATGYYTAYYANIGFMLGMFAAISSLLFNVVGATLFGLHPLQLIRVYLTFPLGEEALSLDICAAVREAVGPGVDILIEGHCRFTPGTAIKFAQLLEPLRPTWFEEPVPHQQLDALVEVARRSPVPIATGESLASAPQFAELLSHNAVHILQPEGWPQPRGYANGVAAEGRLVFVAGQVGWNPRGQFESDDFAQKELGRSKALGALPRDKLNKNGGAIALGHPVGSTGARLLLTTAHELHVADQELGLATLCIGGGQGGAVVLERVLS